MPGNVQITLHKVLCVEGKDECNFFYALLKHENIENVQVIDIGGKDRFKSLFPVIRNAPGFSEIQKLGFIRDAEDLPVKAAFDSICSVLGSLDLPKPADIFHITDALPNIGIYIMPDNKNTGMIEDLCLQTLKGTRVIKCISAYTACYEKLLHKDEKDKYRSSKAQILSYLATRAPMVNNLGLAAQKEYWDFGNSCFNDVKTFLHMLFG